MKARAVGPWLGCLAFVGLVVWLVVRPAAPGVAVVDWRPTSEPVPAPIADEFEVAARAGDVRALESFVAAHPEDAHVVDARARIEELRHDDAVWQRALARPTSESLDAFLRDFPGHAREAEARELRARMEPRSVFDLLAEGAVEISANGAGIKTMRVVLRRHAPHEIAVAIPVGTFFVTGGDAQNMVATRRSIVRLVDDAPVEASVAVACANRSRPIPYAADTFHLEVAPHQRELELLAPVLERADASVPVAQAAVWIVTDDADYAALGLLVYSYDGFSGSRAIDEAAAITALKLCADAGVDVAGRRIAADEWLHLIGLGVPALGVDEWCRAELERRGLGHTAGEILLHVIENEGGSPLADAAARAVPANARAVREAGLARLATSAQVGTRREAAAIYKSLADPADLEIVLGFALDTDSQVRSLGVDALRIFPADQTLDAVVRALGDDDPNVLAAALRTILAAPDPRHVPHLLTLVGSTRPDWLRAQALEVASGLVAPHPAAGADAVLEPNLFDTSAAARAKTAASGTDPTGGVTAAFAAQRSDVRAAIVAALREGDWELAVAALHGLEQDPDVALVPDVIAALRRIDASTFHSEGLRALQKLGGLAARAEILRHVGDPDPAVADMALGCLSDVPNEEFVPLLEELTGKGSDPLVRARVAGSIAYMRTPAAHALLRRFAADEDVTVRRAGVTALSGWVDPDDLEILTRSALDSDVDVRIAVVHACGAIDDARARAVVVRALADPDMGVLDAALDACARRGSPEYVPVLEAALVDARESFQRTRRIEVLAGMGTREAAAALWRLQADTRDVALRCELIATVGPIADASLFPALEAALAAETDPAVRAALEGVIDVVRHRPDPVRPVR